MVECCDSRSASGAANGANIASIALSKIAGENRVCFNFFFFQASGRTPALVGEDRS